MIKKYILILLILPTILQAQSRYLEDKQDGYAFSLGSQTVSGTNESIGFISLSASSKGRSDFGLQIGKSGNFNLFTLFINTYLVKQNERTPLSLGVTAQGNYIKQSRYYYSRSSTSLTFGSFIESNILSTNSGGIIPYLGFYYTTNDQQSEGALGVGLTLCAGKETKFALDIGYLATEGQYNSFVAAITVTLKSDRFSNRNYIE